MNTIDIVFVVVIMMCVLVVIKRVFFTKMEGLESTGNLVSSEALQNIASLYNANKLTTGNLDVTGITNLNKVNIDDELKLKKDLTIDEKLNVKKDLKVDGMIIGNKQVIEVVYPIEWDGTKWTKWVEDKKLFNKDMPDGTKIDVLFVHPGGNDQASPNRWISYVTFIKYGKQFFRFHDIKHENIPNPLINISNDKNWRGDIMT